jgi:hypothetical protein
MVLHPPIETTALIGHYNLRSKNGYFRKSVFRRTCSLKSPRYRLRYKMEQARFPRKTWTVAGGACWGGITALAITLLNWYHPDHIETLRKVIGRFVIFILAGILASFLPVGPIFQNRKHTRSQTIGLFVLFICLMLGLAYLLWAMVRH